jgi:citrate synthase
MDETTGLLTTAEAAIALGVKPATLYSYVSRGILRSHRLRGRRGSWFDPADIDAIGRGRVRPDGGLDLAITTGLTRIDAASLSYRDRDVLELSQRASFESVASLLWTGQLQHVRFDVPRDIARAAHRATAWLPPEARLADRLALIVTGAASADRLRFDLSPAAVAASGRLLIGAMVEGLPRRSRSDPPPLVLSDSTTVDPSIAARLWARLSAEPADDGAAVLNGFLILLADHELATSTVAARVAASTRANPYAAVAAALGTLDGPLHGSVSEEVHALLSRATGPSGSGAAVSDWLRREQRVPGFGHTLYANGDPRARAALPLLRRLGRDPGARRRLQVVEQVRRAVSARTPASPNSDFCLGALAFVAGMPDDAGEAIFAIARTAGWVAHVLEEYGEAPLRFRARAIYSGQPIRSAPVPGAHGGRGSP